MDRILRWTGEDNAEGHDHRRGGHPAKALDGHHESILRLGFDPECPGQPDDIMDTGALLETQREKIFSGHDAFDARSTRK
jgi:hypothetical protein